MSFTTLILVSLIAAVVLGLVITGMAVGVMFSGRTIKGSCGGLNNMPGDGAPCMVCGGEPEQCEEADPTANEHCDEPAACDGAGECALSGVCDRTR